VCRTPRLHFEPFKSDISCSARSRVVSLDIGSCADSPELPRLSICGRRLAVDGPDRLRGLPSLEDPLGQPCRLIGLGSVHGAISGRASRLSVLQ